MKAGILHIAPLILLPLLSFFIGEMLIGSTLVSHFTEMVRIMPTLLFYGTGVLFVRETARRFHLRWMGVLGLGLAYGLFEEAIILNTIFNPNALGFDLSYGRMWGVNWIWAITITVYHAVWSITIPIIIVELFFRTKGTDIWLGSTGYRILIGLFGLSAVILYVAFHQFFTYTPTLDQFVTVAIILIALILLSLQLHRNEPGDQKHIHPIVVGVVAFMGALILFIFQILVFEKSPVAAWKICVALLVVLAFTTMIFNRWHLRYMHQLALASGSLLASALYGLLIVKATGTKIDFAAQITFIILVLILPGLLRRTLSLEVTKSDRSSL